MYTADVERMVQLAEKKVTYLRHNPVGYLVLSVLAGIYLGFGICLIFSVGAPFWAEGSAGIKLVMGLSFGVALTLVMFAGSELFTGNTMVGAFGALAKAITIKDVGVMVSWSLVGNLAGSLGFAWLVAQSGVVGQAPQNDLLLKTASFKMNLPMWELLVRGILCNWLVCLAIWMAARTTNDAAKIMLIAWCLFAFVGSGFEHSIANQSILGLALFLPHGPEVSWGGFLWNQLWVVMGNSLGGVVFMAGAYWVTSPMRGRIPITDTASEMVAHETAQQRVAPAASYFNSQPVIVGRRN